MVMFCCRTHLNKVVGVFCAEDEMELREQRTFPLLHEPPVPTANAHSSLQTAAIRTVTSHLSSQVLKEALVVCGRSHRGVLEATANFAQTLARNARVSLTRTSTDLLMK